MTLATAAGNDDQADLAALRDTFETAVAALNTGNLDGFLDTVKHLQQGLIGRNWQAKGASGNPGALLAAFGDELANRHALGHFASDVLLKLGLLGTIVGFILMLIPVGDRPAPRATAPVGHERRYGRRLYTTLAGLITSTLLKLQYHVLDASAAELATRLAVLTDVHLTRDAT